MNKINSQNIKTLTPNYREKSRPSEFTLRLQSPYELGPVVHGDSLIDPKSRSTLS